LETCPVDQQRMRKKEITLGDFKTYLSKIILLRMFQIAQTTETRITT
jgi:hypothetical protein